MKEIIKKKRVINRLCLHSVRNNNKNRKQISYYDS